MKRNVLIEASAGTGKTQALARRLIALMEHGVKPEEIVALTFSRAAAGEIFERLVSLLAEDGKAELLRKVLAKQHLSQIGTLDSFLIRIVRAFPHELGVSPDLEIMEDYNATSERAKISFSILRRTDAKLKKTFVDAFSLAMNREDVRSFVESYRSFISAWHEKVTALPDEKAWGEATTIWGRDPAFAHVTERELALAADQLLTTFSGDAKWKEFADWVRAFRGSFSGVKGYTKKLVEADDVFEGDAYAFKFSRSMITLSREETLVVRDALICVYGYVVRMKLELAKGVYKLISAFEAEYDKRVRAEGRLVFADVPRLLTKLSAADRLELEYRLDSKLGAWALDEFQDTSREQWRALENLLDEAKQGEGKSVFVVGDRKQAIYGWRNGDVSIFTRERDSGIYEKDELIKTYRSGPEVIEAVNRVFARGRIKTEFPAWECPEHVTAKPDLHGFVRVEDAPGRSMEDFVEPVYLALKARPKGSAAVLVRNNRFGALLADRLKAKGLKDVVWEGESAILDTPALSGFLDLIALAEHPGDMLTYRHFAMTPLAKAKWPNGLPPIATLSREIAESLTTIGLVRTLRELRAVLPERSEDAWSHFTEERYTDMLRAAAEFELGVKAGTRLTDFPRYLEAKKKRTVAEDGKVKIMTIHRSKGLGFDFVVLPLYEHDSLTSESSGPLIGKNWILPDPTAKVAKAIGGLEDAYALRKNRDEQEALCAYYVAMTRAKKAMTIVCHPAGTSLKFSDLVRSAELEGLGNESAALPDIGRARTQDGPTGVQPLPAPDRGPRTTLKRRLPSLQFTSGMSAGSLFASTDARREAMARGSAAHKRMEEVEFSAELPKPEGFVELWRERAFEVYAEGEWISGRFDRVTFFNTPEGLSAEIVDFKSSLAHPERYDAQLAAYRRAVHALTAIPFERITARLVKI